MSEHLGGPEDEAERTSIELEAALGTLRRIGVVEQQRLGDQTMARIATAAARESEVAPEDQVEPTRTFLSPILGGASDPTSPRRPRWLAPVTAAAVLIVVVGAAAALNRAGRTAIAAETDPAGSAASAPDASADALDAEMSGRDGEGSETKPTLEVVTVEVEPPAQAPTTGPAPETTSDEEAATTSTTVPSTATSAATSTTAPTTGPAPETTTARPPPETTTPTDSAPTPGPVPAPASRTASLTVGDAGTVALVFVDGVPSVDSVFDQPGWTHSITSASPQLLRVDFTGPTSDTSLEVHSDEDGFRILIGGEDGAREGVGETRNFDLGEAGGVALRFGPRGLMSLDVQAAEGWGHHVDIPARNRLEVRLTGPPARRYHGVEIFVGPLTLDIRSTP